MKNNRLAIISTGILAALPLFGQSQLSYPSTNGTGQFVLARTVNLQALSAQAAAFSFVPELQPKAVPKRLHPPISSSLSIQSQPAMKNLIVSSQGATVGFNALTHAHQRLASGGNQFSVEPPNPSIAVGNGFVLEGVNNAIQVYDSTGVPQLSRVLASNEVFGVPAAINRNTGANGVYPTDMRVFYDHGVDRFFVLQRAQDNDINGGLLNSSHMYLAVSQTSNPTGIYNVYEANTTNAQQSGCPCLADYPQIGADQYGFYISSGLYGAQSQGFVIANILGISKSALAAGVVIPPVAKFMIPLSFGYEFAIQPATTPPGGSYFLGNGGVEFFASTIGTQSGGAGVAVWAMTNTSSLATANPVPILTRIIVPTLTYIYPDAANQPAGPRPYGESLQAPLSLIDGGDIRTLSLSYAGAKLHVTLSTKATDEAGRSVVGGAYIVLSPSLRGTVLSAPVYRQSYQVVGNNHLLRPSVAVDAQGRGAIAATLVGPDWFPTAAFIPVDLTKSPTTIRIAKAGELPEDGFTGYTGGFGIGIARWGDYSSAVIASDGSVWMVAQYIGNLPRTDFANWDTFIMSIKP